MIELPLLTILSLTPNPFLEKPSEHQDPIQLSATSVPSLVEIMSREFLKDCSCTVATTTLSTYRNSGSTSSLLSMETDTTHLIPDDLRGRLLNISEMNKCHTCHKKFCRPDVEQIVWRQVFNRPDIPVSYRYCSIHCSKNDTVQ